MKFHTQCLAFSLLMFSADISHAALQNGKVQVATSKGESSLTDPKSVKEVAVTGKLFEQGYKVETTKDSTVELCLSNGSTLLLNPETLIEVRTFRQVASNLIVEGSYQKLEKEPSPSVVEIQVVKGKIIGEVRKLNPQSSFTIKTPAGVARIRGTVYTVEYNENKSNKSGNMEVSCIKGSVEVTVNGSNSGPTPVEPGKKMIAQAPIVEAGIQITPVLDFEPLPFFTPTINITKLDPSEIKEISQNLSSGTGLPPPSNDPPPSPSPSKVPTPPPANKDVKDSVDKTVQETIEKDNQKNPSPTGG